MTARPTVSPLFATDATLVGTGAGVEAGLPPRADPGSGSRAQGFYPKKLPARWLNFMFGLFGDWLSYLDGRAAQTFVHEVSAAGITIPANVTQIDVTVVGGGGGGSSGGGGDSTGSCGGGSGYMARQSIPRALVGDTYDVVIGTGGNGGASVAFGGPSANLGVPGGFSSVTFIGPGNVAATSATVQAAGGAGGQHTAGGAGYSGGGGAGSDNVTAGYGGSFGSNGQT